MATENKQIILDDRFFTPPGIVDVRSEGQENGAVNYTPDIVASDDEAPVLSDPSQTVPNPTSFSVVDQHVRISSDGRATVDVTLEFPDIPGIQSIDVQVTKA